MSINKNCIFTQFGYHVHSTVLLLESEKFSKFSFLFGTNSSHGFELLAKSRKYLINCSGAGKSAVLVQSSV